MTNSRRATADNSFAITRAFKRFSRRKLLSKLAFILFILSSPAYAQGFSCNPSGNQQEMNACAGDSQAKIGLELENLLLKKKVALSEANKKLLEDSQNAWTQYRDARCLYEVGPREGGGSIWSAWYDQCLERVNKERIETLKAYIQCTNPQKGCPI